MLPVQLHKSKCSGLTQQVHKLAEFQKATTNTVLQASHVPGGGRWPDAFPWALCCNVHTGQPARLKRIPVLHAVRLAVPLTLRLSFKASYSASSSRTSSGTSLEAVAAAAAAAPDVPPAQPGCGDSGVLAPATHHHLM